MDWNYGIKKIWEENADFQLTCLDTIAKEVRNVKNDELALITVEDMRKAGMFYVPNDDYMLSFFGSEVLNYKNGVYFNDICKLSQRLAIPMPLLDNTTIGFIGYSNSNDEGDTDNKIFIKYLYPPKFIMDKGRYFYITREEYLKAVKDEYICIVDGIFDKRRLQSVGINAVSLCGSALTEWHMKYLSFIKHKIVVADNDSAGRKLVSYCKYKMPGTIEIKQGDAWDIDDFLKTKENIQRFKEAFELAKSTNFLLPITIKSPRTSIFKEDFNEENSRGKEQDKG